GTGRVLLPPSMSSSPASDTTTPARSLRTATRRCARAATPGCYCKPALSQAPAQLSTALARRASGSRALIGHEHVDANHASLRRGADLHEVTEMVHEPQAASAWLIDGGVHAPDQRLPDVPGVADLTHQRSGLGPDS